MISPDTDPLGSILLDATARYGDRLAIQTVETGLSYNQLGAMVTGLASALGGQGVGRTAVVGMAVTDDELKAVVSVLALTLLGARWTEYGDHLRGSTTIQLTHLLHDDTSRPAEPGAISIDSVWPAMSVGGSPSTAADFEGCGAADAPWFLATSSGTTGSRKAMAISQAMFAARIAELTEYPSAGEGGQFSVASLFGVYANLTWLHLWQALRAGGTCLLSRNYEFLAARQASLVVGSPHQMAAFLSENLPPETPAMLECRVLGAALPPVFGQRLQFYFRNVRVSYGATEVGPVCSRLASFAIPGSDSVGPPYTGVQVQIIGDDQSSVQAEAIGTVRIRAPGMVNGYLGDEEASSQSFRDGWFYPGDIGYLDAAGELHLSGRVQDHLNIGGTTVDAMAVDQVMCKTEKVVDALCFVEHGESGIGHLAAMVVLEADADRKAVIKAIIKELMRDGLSQSLLPKNIYQADAVPRNDNGKPMRHQALALVPGLTPIARLGG